MTLPLSGLPDLGAGAMSTVCGSFGTGSGGGTGSSGGFGTGRRFGIDATTLPLSGLPYLGAGAGKQPLNTGGGCFETDSGGGTGGSGGVGTGRGFGIGTSGGAGAASYLEDVTVYGAVLEDAVVLLLYSKTCSAIVHCIPYGSCW